ncbi:MAG: translation initiation factor [Bacteroidia bacterium]|nr:translation initiation factor [Bacteroidia bacterium]MDW8133480.1 translation initiation factor [Bacteroidia bacterium]
MKEQDRLVYSTRPLKASPPPETQTPQKQNLRVSRKRIAGNKEITEIMGFIGKKEDLENLARQLRQMCATGGSVVGSKIILQGNCVEKVLAFLQKEGHIAKRSGG